MRLIDADVFKKDLKAVTLSNGTLVNTNIMLALIDKYPTAYDIDKVVEELKIIKDDALAEYNMAEYNLDNNIGNSVAENYRKDMNEGKCFALEDAFALEYAIEIVKQGVVSDDVCEWKLDGVYLISPHPLVSLSCITNDGYRYNYCPVCGKKIKAVE